MKGHLYNVTMPWPDQGMAIEMIAADLEPHEALRVIKAYERQDAPNSELEDKINSMDWPKEKNHDGHFEIVSIIDGPIYKDGQHNMNGSEWRYVTFTRPAA